MSNLLNPNQLLFVRAIADAVRGNGFDSELERMRKVFAGYHPQYRTRFGVKSAVFKKVERSRLNGEVVGYYDLTVDDHRAGVREVTTVLYAVRGTLTEIKAFPTRFYGLRR